MENSPNLGLPATPPAEEVVTNKVVHALRGTKPWVRLCSVLGFISTGFMLLAAVMMGLGGGFMMLSGSEAAEPVEKIMIGIYILIIVGVFVAGIAGAFDLIPPQESKISV